MAFRGLSTLRRVTCPCRYISSKAVSMDEAACTRKRDELTSRILKLVFPRRSATAVLQNWVDQGHKVTTSGLRDLARQLLKFRRHKHALEVLTWMESQNRFQLSGADHAIKVELIIRIQSLADAEEYFKCLTNSSSQKAACIPLLHALVKERDIKKAQAFMLKLTNLGLTVSPHPFNEMMKLYMATSHIEKVPSVIHQMKQNKIPLNVLSYNLWMSACSEVSGVATAEVVYREMVCDKNVEVGWSTLSTLANIYLKSGLLKKANLALKCAEKKLSVHNRLGYFFLITMYTSLSNKEEVLRIWEVSKKVGGRITSTNYMCILLCLVKLGDIAETERIFREWESKCWKYDIRVSNVLLGAYMRAGSVDKAESLHLHTLERGGHPNYKTWEILMEGWIKSQNMDKAINAMKEGFPMLKHCDWRPNPGLVMAIADYLEKHGSFNNLNQYVKVIHHLGIANLSLYKSLLRMHLLFQQPGFDTLKMMEKDKIKMDDETSALVQALKV